MQGLYSELPAAGAGEWVYEHLGSTQRVVRVQGRTKKIVLARGVFKLMVEGQMKAQRLDEYPLDLAGEPLGWTTQENFDLYRVWEEDEDKWAVDEVEEAVGGADDSGGAIVVDEAAEEREEIVELVGDMDVDASDDGEWVTDED